jgi:nitrite reductase/ring-hydroxylating ferredoxin subunit
VCAIAGHGTRLGNAVLIGRGLSSMYNGCTHGSSERFSVREEGEMDWIKVLPQDALPHGQRRVVQVKGRAVLLLHHQAQIYAVDDTCPHMGASLEEGEITEDASIVCPRHHSAFDLRTGEAREWTPWPPGVGRLLGSVSREKALAVYPTRVDEDGIWVGVEEGG